MSRRPRFAAAVPALVVALLSASFLFAADGEKVLLRTHYKAGERYLFRVAQHNDATQQAAGGASMSMKQDTGMEIGMEVLDVADDGNARMKVTYDRMSMKMETPNGELDYDSGDPAKKNATGPAVMGIRALVGKTLTVTISPRGEIKGVKGYEKIAESILEQIPEGPKRENVRKQLDATMDERHFTQQMQALGISFPEQAVGVGDAWRRELTVDMGPVRIDVNSEYKVVKITPEAVEIAVTGTLSSRPPEATATVAVTLGEGTAQSATVRLDRADPIAMTSESTQTLIMNITSGTQAVRQTVKGGATVTVKRLEK